MSRLRFCVTILIFVLVSGAYARAGVQSPDSVLAVMKRVADWQIKDYPNNTSKWTHTPTMWTNGVLYVGMAEWASVCGNDYYYEWLKNIGAKERWHVDKGMYFADDICVAQLYCQLYEKYGDKSMLYPTQARIDWVMAHPSDAELDYFAPGSHNRWCWCDALFMAPTVYARMAKITGEQRYWDFMEREFWATVDLLYDKEESLFYRDTRYITMREKNGKKVFWGRGNGWVVGALAVIIDCLAEDYPSRGRYIELYQQMMQRVAGLQDANGFWHASMLDTEAYPMPETSSSAFFTYGLAWGINRGFLPRSQYRPVMDKAWGALLSTVHSDGKLGWVQAIGSDPQSVSFETSEVYGVGAFLMAGAEVYKMTMKENL